MKKITLLLGVMSLLIFSSCKKTEPETETTHTDTIIVETPAEAPPTPAEADGTSVKVGSDGVSYDSKDGKTKTTVEVKNGEAAIEIKK